MSREMLVVPDTFPLAPKYCSKPASNFFECFTEKGASNGEDPEAGAKGIEACASTLKAYEKCMATWRRKNPQEEFYRVRDVFCAFS